MNCPPDRLLIVTDRHQALRPLPAIAAEILAAGAKWIWLRDRDLAAGERAALATELMHLARQAKGALSIGGDVELALRLQADGVHLGDAPLIPAARRILGKGALIGLSAHSVDDVRQAAEAGADYACLSPIFSTPSKPGYGPPLGAAAIAAAARLGIPIVALGGICTSRVTECMAAGASAVAVMGEVMRATDPAQATAELLGAIEAVSGAGSLRAIG